MVKIVIDNYEDREKELLAENQKLKKSLYDLHKELKLHIHDYGSDDLDLCKGLVDLDAKDPLESFSVRLFLVPEWAARFIVYLFRI